MQSRPSAPRSPSPSSPRAPSDRLVSGPCFAPAALETLLPAQGDDFQVPTRRSELPPVTPGLPLPLALPDSPPPTPSRKLASQCKGHPLDQLSLLQGVLQRSPLRVSSGPSPPAIVPASTRALRGDVAPPACVCCASPRESPPWVGRTVATCSERVCLARLGVLRARVGLPVRLPAPHLFCELSSLWSCPSFWP